MSSKTFLLEYGIKDNHWVGHLVMKHIDDVESQKIELIRKGDNDKSENFEMEILSEGELNKALIVSEKIRQ